MIMSDKRKNTEAKITITNTMPVVTSVSFRVGHVTFRVSERTSWMKCIIEERLELDSVIISPGRGEKSEEFQAWRHDL